MQLPWRAAPRAALASPWTALVSLVAAVVVGFVAAAALFYVDASGNAGVVYEAGKQCSQAIPPMMDGFQLTGDQAAQADSIAREVAPRYGFPQVTFAEYTGAFLPQFHDGRPYLRLGYREGATDHLTPVAGGGRDGVWLPQTAASETHTGLGDRAENVALPPVSAIYPDQRAPLPDWWCTEGGHVLLPPLVSDSSAIAGTARLVAWVPTPAVLGHTGLPLDITLRFPVPAPTTTAQASAEARRGHAMLAELNDRLAVAGLAGKVAGTSDFDMPLSLALQARQEVWASILALAAVSLLVGMSAVGAVGVQWCQRRQAELRLLWSRGSSPLALGGLAMLELAAPIGLGALGGLGIARLTLRWYAPTDAVNPGGAGLAAGVVLGCAAMALLVLGGTVALRMRRVLEGVRSSNSAARAARFVPWEAVTGAVAICAWSRVVHGLVVSRNGLTVPRIDPLTLLFPLLVVVTVAGVGNRLVRLALAGSHKLRLWSIPAVAWAVRRLAASKMAVGGILLVGVLAVGALAVGRGVSNSENDALDAKSGLLLGANTVAQVAPTPSVQHDVLPAALAGDSTFTALERDGAYTILAVDPNTFANAAWLPHDGSVQRVLTQLRHSGGPAPAVRIGDAPGGAVSALGVAPLQVIGSAPRFPGLPDAAGYVIPISALTDPNLVDAWYVWSAANPIVVGDALNTAGIEYSNPQSRAHALDALPFLTVRWTFGFITALGTVLALVAAASLVLAVEVRRRQHALSATLAVRMGLSRRTLIASHVAELGVVGAFAVFVGTGTGIGSTDLAVPHLDPAPWLHPSPSAPNLWLFVLLTAATTAVVVALTVWAAVRSVRTAKVGELLRG
jgi:putative ABC transport system permease protein